MRTPDGSEVDDAPESARGADTERSWEAPSVPIVARLEDEHGNAITVDDPNGGSCDAAGDFDELLPFDDPAYRCLGVIDPYGDTIFNRLQMPVLLSEVDALERGAK